MKLPIEAIEIQKITNNNYKTYHEETEAIQAYLDKQEKAFSLHVVTTRLNVDVKIFKKHRCCVGTIKHKSDFGFNHWIVEWDNGNLSREYGLDLNVW